MNKIGILLLVMVLALISTPPAGAQGAEERLIVRLTKVVDSLSWMNEMTLIGTLSALGFFTGDIVLITVQGGEVRTIGNGRCPSLSPDRARLAWIPGPSSRGDVWVMDLRRLDRRRLTEGLNAGCVTWSPDGRRMAVAVTSATSRTGDDIVIVSADTGKVELVISAGEENLHDSTWTPDSRLIAFAVSRSDSMNFMRLRVNRIDTFDLRTHRRSQLVNLLPLNEIHSARDLTYAPDGQTLLFVIGGHLAEIRGLRGLSIERVTVGHAPAWQNDGKALAFARPYDCPPFPCFGDDLYLRRLP